MHSNFALRLVPLLHICSLVLVCLGARSASAVHCEPVSKLIWAMSLLQQMSGMRSTLWIGQLYFEQSLPSAVRIRELDVSAPSRVAGAWRANDHERLWSTTGVRQGDPTGPLLFALGLLEPLAKLAREFPDVHVLAYLDDVYIVQGPMADVERAFLRFSELCKSIGLEMATEMCEVWSPGDPCQCRSVGLVFISCLITAAACDAAFLAAAALTHWCVTKRRNSWACIGNPNQEQETIKGTQAQETPAY